MQTTVDVEDLVDRFGIDFPSSTPVHGPFPVVGPFPTGLAPGIGFGGGFECNLGPSEVDHRRFVVPPSGGTFGKVVSEFVSLKTNVGRDPA